LVFGFCLRSKSVTLAASNVAKGLLTADVIRSMKWQNAKNVLIEKIFLNIFISFNFTLEVTQNVFCFRALQSGKKH